MVDDIQREEDNSKTGLSKEMIDRIQKMKMGQSKRDCPVCYESFKKG